MVKMVIAKMRGEIASDLIVGEGRDLNLGLDPDRGLREGVIVMNAVAIVVIAIVARGAVASMLSHICAQTDFCMLQTHADRSPRINLP